MPASLACIYGALFKPFPPPPKKKHPDQKNKCPIYPPIFPTTKNETQGLSNLSDNLPAFFVQDFVTGFYFLVDGAPWSGSSCGGFWKVWKLQQNEGGSNNAVDGNTPTTWRVSMRCSMNQFWGIRSTFHHQYCWWFRNPARKAPGMGIKHCKRSALGWRPWFTWKKIRHSFEVILFMEEIRRSPVEVVSWNPITYQVFYTFPGGDRRLWGAMDGAREFSCILLLSQGAKKKTESSKSQGGQHQWDSGFLGWDNQIPQGALVTSYPPKSFAVSLTGNYWCLFVGHF